MARLPRLAVPGHAHLVLHRAHGAQALFADDEDRSLALQSLREALDRCPVALHAYALLRDRVWLLLTPPTDTALGRLLQSFGRAYTARFNHRHGSRGTVWAGRYRSTVVEPGRTLQDVLVFVDQSPTVAGLVMSAGDWPWSSAIHHLGTARDPLLTPAAAYWALGNTPFDRAAAYGALLSEALSVARESEIAAAAEKGWVLGSAAFMAQLAHATSRPLQPRPRGRPKGQDHAISVPN